MKVDYTTNGGARSVAYLDGEPVNGRATATDKYTDDDVTLRWDGTNWTETD